MMGKRYFIVLLAFVFFFMITSCKLVDLASQVISAPTYTPYPTYTPQPTYTPYAQDAELANELALDFRYSAGMTLGDPNAPVKVVEFSDYQCPWCQNYVQSIEPGIIEKFVDQGKVFYAVSPMAFLGQESIDAALASYCANDQGFFWEYRAELFANLGGKNVGDYSIENLVSYAGSVGLDLDRFQVCMAAGEHQGDLNDAETYANYLGVNSTPSFWVNGEIVSANELETAIENALNGN